MAFLAARTGDVAGAEDALGDALMAALATWPRDGVPRTPEAWLLTAARRRLIDSKRRERVRTDGRLTLRADRRRIRRRKGSPKPFPTSD